MQKKSQQKIVRRRKGLRILEKTLLKKTPEKDAKPKQCEEYRILKDNSPTAAITSSEKSTYCCFVRLKRLNEFIIERRKNLVENLQSDLSPKYIGFSSAASKRNRNAKPQRYKEKDDLLHTNIASYVRNQPLKLKAVTLSGRVFKQKFVSYESPIEKLIKINKYFATMAVNYPPVYSVTSISLPENKLQNAAIQKNIVLADNNYDSNRSTGSELNDVNRMLFAPNASVGPTELSSIQSPIETDKNLIDFGFATSEPLAFKLKEVQKNEVTNHLGISKQNEEQTDQNNPSLRQASQSPTTNLTHKKKINSIFDTPSPKNSNDIAIVKTNGIEINVTNLRLMSASPLANSTDSVAEFSLSGLQASSSKISHTLISEGSDNAEIFKQNKEKLMEIDPNMRQMSKSPSATSTDSAKGSSIDTSIDDAFRVGDIFWGKISSFPFWPCIVWPDPKGEIVSMIGKNQIQIHVRFFADNGRRSWIRKVFMLPYNGRKHFENQMYLFRDGNKKDSNYFYISDKKKNLWEQAIREAEIVLQEPLEERCAKYNTILMESRKIELEVKRRRPPSINQKKAASVMSEDTSSVLSDLEYLLPGSKRLRSLTPESPIYEGFEDLNMFVKRRKLTVTGEKNDNDMRLNEYNFPAKVNQKNVKEKFKDKDFNTLYNLMRDFVLLGENAEMENKLKNCVADILLIRNLAIEERKKSNTDSFALIDSKHFSRHLKTVSKEDNSPVNGRNSVSNDSTKKETKIKPIEEVVDDIFELNKNFLFKGLHREPVCKLCYKPSELVKCSGSCQSWMHMDCNNISSVNGVNNLKGIHVTGDVEDLERERTTGEKPIDKVMCKECKNPEKLACFVCKEINTDLGERFKCHVHWCTGVYHISCLKYWPQAKLTKSSAKVETLLCPRHVCHICVCDDPRGKFLQITKQKLVRCVECPATYHQDSFCIPAGTIFLTTTSIKCPLHRRPDEQTANVKSLNANWCFICTKGGKLICCETCPTSFHIECLKIDQPEDNYICEECETGRLPLYGDIVWAKLSCYRWWPALILPPPEIPKNLNRIAHNEHDFCVRFLGSSNHTWIARRRVFLYHEGDWGKVPEIRKIDEAYNNGLIEARKIFEKIQEKKQSQINDSKDKLFQPLPYIKIKSNKPVRPVKLPEIDVSASTPCDCNPSDLNPCGLNSGCLNRSLYTECNSKICPAGNKCQNQLFEKRVYPPLTLCRTNVTGWGLKCEKDLMAGDFIIEYVGEIIDQDEFKRRIAQKQEEKDENYYFITLEKDYKIDAGPKGNLARFINHSCEPNCETQKWTVNGVTRIGLFAIEDITADTELTFNYNLACIGDNKKKCYCGTKKCAGFIGAKYKEPKNIKSKTVQTKSKKTRKTQKKKTT